MKKASKASLFVLILLLSVTPAVASCSKKTGEEKNLERVVEIDWEVRNEYFTNDKVIFRVFPPPDLTAEKSHEYLIDFIDPSETFAGKEFTIHAYHKDTGERIATNVPTTDPVIQSKRERYLFTLTLPHSGLWRYEIVIDEQVYGDVILLVN